MLPSMSIVNSPTSQAKDRFSIPIVDDSNGSDAERQLCEAVDTMLAGITRMLQQFTNERSTKVKLQGATASFLRANGIRIAQENKYNDNAGATAACAALLANNTNSSISDPEAGLRTQLEHCRDLLRRVDSERRHLRKQCVHLQGEQDQRRAEVEVIHRYSAESHQRSLTLERQVAEERQRRRQLEEQLDTQMQELMQLRRVLRALPGGIVTSLDSSMLPASSSTVLSLEDATLPLIPDRRFEEAFKDKMNNIVYKRRYRRARQLHQAASEQLEALLMEHQDPQCTSPRWAFPGESRPTNVDPAGAAAVDGSSDASHTVGGGNSDPSATHSTFFGAHDLTGSYGSTDSSTAAALASAVFWQSALDFSFKLPFSTTTPQDPLIKSLIHHSQYAEPLTQLREHTLRLSSRLKTTQDAGLRTLYTTFNQALRRSGTTAAASSSTETQCRSLYERQMDKMQRAHRELLYSLIDQVNHAATAIPELERSGGSGNASRGGSAGTFASSFAMVQRRDVGCSAQDSVSVEEYRTSQLREQLTKLKLQSLEAAATALKEKEAAAARCTTARQEALQALQSLKKLTTCVITSMQVQKPFLAAEAVFDPLEHVKEPITEEILDDPRLMTKMAEATDLTLTYVRRLASAGISHPLSLTPSPTGVAAEGIDKGQASPSRAPANPTASARLSSTVTFDTNSTREATYGHIIDIHRCDSTSSGDAADRVNEASHHRKNSNHPQHSLNIRAVRIDRRRSAPASTSSTMCRPRSRSATAAANRRHTVLQLPIVRKPPTAPTTERGACGRPERGESVSLRTPSGRVRKMVPSAPFTSVPHGVPKVAGESPAKPDGRSPHAPISVIELGFSERNNCYT